MTTEEKAKAYNETLERAKRLYNSTLTKGLRRRLGITTRIALLGIRTTMWN